MKICSSRILLAGAILSLSGFATAIEASDYSSFYKNLPIELSPVTPPSIPSYEVDITAFGGVNDGVTLNTEAFAKAMAHLADKGGGRLVVPEGIWYTGPILLKVMWNFISTGGHSSFSARIWPTILLSLPTGKDCLPTVRLRLYQPATSTT